MPRTLILLDVLKIQHTCTTRDLVTIILASNYGIAFALCVAIGKFLTFLMLEMNTMFLFCWYGNAIKTPSFGSESTES